MKKVIYSFVISFLFITAEAYAVQEPRPLAIDHRIRTVLYGPNEVYAFKGHYRYQSSIEFAPEEKIGTVSLGDSTAWQITPLGNRIFLKPIDRDATTNMTVITDRRVYHFELYGEESPSIRDDEMTFVLRFVYPDQNFSAVRKFNAISVPDLIENKQNLNFNYTISGSDLVAPLRIFDDGEFTYFQFKRTNAEIPSFFQVGSDGKESIINYRVVGDYIVIERVVSQFTLRAGPDIVCVFNEAMPFKRK